MNKANRSSLAWFGVLVVCCVAALMLVRQQHTGFPDPDHPTLADLPLILSRLEILAEMGALYHGSG
jgi:hypothetical protein